MVGTKAVKAAGRRGRVAALVVAGDAAESAVARLGRLADEVPRLSVGTRTALGRALGRGEVAVVAITDRRLAERILEESRALGDERDDDIGARQRSRRRFR
ncbi:MAG: hypothetical protein R3266_10075 [Gemmatimonadota bacterium]|nr:hypothetical protein [Gemmatimonadota bacterium]